MLTLRGTSGGIDMSINRKRIEITFIILHYNAICETKNLVKSIYDKLESGSFKIVIVDNASPNGSGIVLKEFYSGKPEITVITNQKNLGFAEGNNTGIDYCRYHFIAKYICCINNDTLILDKYFLNNVEKEYKRSGAAVIGHKAYLKDGSIQFSAFKLKSLEYYQGLLSKYKTNVKLTKEKSYKLQLKSNHPAIFNILKHIKSIPRNIYLNTRHENVILHGSCLIFTPAYFEKLKGFDNRTFLYREEELLYISLKKNGLKSVYSPDITITHLEDAATDSIVTSDEEKKAFIRNNQVHSLQILIEELEHME